MMMIHTEHKHSYNNFIKPMGTAHYNRPPCLCYVNFLAIVINQPNLYFFDGLKINYFFLVFTKYIKYDRLITYFLDSLDYLFFKTHTSHTLTFSTQIQFN